MTTKQDHYLNRFEIGVNPHAIPSKSYLSASKSNQSLERLASGREALIWETIGLLEDVAVQEIMKPKGTQAA